MVAKAKKDPVSSLAQQPMISSFFSQQPTPTKEASKPHKRAGSPIDLTVDDIAQEAPPRKKNRTEDEPFSVSESSGVHAEQWRFVTESPDRPQPLKKVRTPAEEAARKKNHEAFKKRLLGENSSFLTMRRSGEASTTPMDIHSEVPCNDDSEEESDSGFRGLREQIANPPKGRMQARSAVIPKNKIEEIGPSGQTWTPLEKQVLQLRKDNKDVLLMIECGYKFKFFNEDAKIAALELGIVAFPHRNFIEASIPVHRRDVHLKKLLSKGHKVGIVEQTETAALKAAGENRNKPFERKLKHLYTAATYVDELGSVDDVERYDAPPLMCITETPKGGMGVDEQVTIAMITICPSTGDVVYDEFDDNYMRLELETRMVHMRPAELLLPAKRLSSSSEKMLAHFSENASDGVKIRVERFKEQMPHSDAFSYVSEFYTDRRKSAIASESFNSGKLMAAITDFSKNIVVVLAHTIKYLSAFNVADAFLGTKFFCKFTTRAHMLLNGNTLTNLEIYRNETDFTTRGSLMWILDRTTTKFGARLLRNWVGKPLVDTSILQARVDAVEEILSSTSEHLATLRQVLKKLPDLAKGLCRIQYGKCTPEELASLLPAFGKIAKAFTACDSPPDFGFKSSTLNDILYSLTKLSGPIQGLLDAVIWKQAIAGRKDLMWSDPDKHPAIADADLAIKCIEAELMDELKTIRKLLKKPALQYTTVAGEEFVFEVGTLERREIPLTWNVVSKTKSVTRYRTPEIVKKLQERAQLVEILEEEARKAFASFLDEIAQSHYGIMRSAVNNLATADCLLSLARVGLQEGYVRPEFTESDTLEIIEGRHPMVEALRLDPFVPNTIRMGDEEPRSKIITGPNMGGKSSSVKMVALITIMAQIGSYVPAQAAKLGILDGVLTRMGASDELARGRSTFMVEMTETSEILSAATDKSLVILDELGRGTSTVDGMAVASAVLQHLLRTTKCKTLFITHYPLVATDLERRFPSDVQNFHMGYAEEHRIDGTREITFLHKLTSGIAKESFGVECARLAGLPEDMLQVATYRSSSLRDVVEMRSRKNKAKKCAGLLRQCLRDSSSVHSRNLLEELRKMAESMTI